MIDVKAARELLDMGARIGSGQRADEQLEGTVAIFNLLHREKVAYLADEVGMGKTYVALGAVALFRHLNPGFRLLVIAPRENIQSKWIKEMRNFVAHNVRFRDLRVKGADGRPMRPLVNCGNLISLIHEASISPDRDFFARLTSFSLALPGREEVDRDKAYELRDRLREYVPWLDNRIFDLRSKQGFKDNFAKAVCCALPVFDLVIVDEGHNLKHGFSTSVSARNRVLALAMGHPSVENDSVLFPRYASRAQRVLFLSATPVEESYRHLWNQLDIFGRAAPYAGLIKDGVEEEEKKALAGRFLIRRVSGIRVAGQELTKNLYRREWRRGGMKTHDEPIHIDNVKEKLAVALVQKKVAEILGHEKFNSSFQIGMLASFESFLQTAKVRRGDEDEGAFDDSEQTDDAVEKEGIDVADVNRLADSYRRTFDSELPHPKMDSVVQTLDGAWERGHKALIFVRRVASVKELKRKLDERFDRWIMERLRTQLPAEVAPKLERVFEDYRSEKRAFLRATGIGVPVAMPVEDGEDEGGADTFFAWFFRGQGPQRVVSGARIQQRFIERGTAVATFFEDNYVADLLGCDPSEAFTHLAEALAVDRETLRNGLTVRSKAYLSRAKRQPRADRFEAVQAAALEWLMEKPGPAKERAAVVWNQRFVTSLKAMPADQGVDPEGLLETATFFTELRRRRQLRDRLWPEPATGDATERFREQEIRRQLLASAARLGHSLIDFYVLVIGRLRSLEPRVQEAAERDEVGPGLVGEYLDLLERQMAEPVASRPCGAFDELAAIAENFHLILDVNLPGAREEPLSETARQCGQLLRQQQPVGGMAGQVNKTLVSQFRMPGYPLILVSTDLLQEGEDLHTFCSDVYHYGISWTPSSMEQRTGRVDRVRSATDRRLTVLGRAPEGSELLQVYLPHLEDTVEVFQVQRVLERMNAFMRLMHVGLIQEGNWSRQIRVADEIAAGLRQVPVIREPLRTAFPVKPEFTRPRGSGVRIDRVVFDRKLALVSALLEATRKQPGYVWEDPTEEDALLGTAQLAHRIQPFALHVTNLSEHLAIRCVSPIGNVGPEDRMEDIIALVAERSLIVGAILRDDRSYDLTLEGEVLVGNSVETGVGRVIALVQRIVKQADELEQALLEGRDAPMAEFRTDLRQEGNDGR